jgi:uncharacterized cysteine cluster protein YcgN (CxxCxxCC family)
MSKFTKRLSLKINPQNIQSWDVPKLEPYLKKAKLSKKVWDSICKRCGDCCKLPSGEYCQHFYFDKDGLGVCKLYPNHEGTILIKKGDLKDWIVCTSIAFTPEITERCNYRLTFPEKVKKHDQNK